jgi:hypothetical protein
LNKIKPLKDYVSVDKFKSFAELKTKLDSVLSASGGSPVTQTAESLVDALSAMPIAAPKVAGRVIDEPKVETKSSDDGDSDDIEDYFKNIAS